MMILRTTIVDSAVIELAEHEHVGVEAGQPDARLLGGRVRQAGRFRVKGAARERSQEVVDELNRGGDDPTLTLLAGCLPRGVDAALPAPPCTEETNKERLERYVLPYLPKGGHEPIGQIRRLALLAVQDQLLRAWLSKTTFSALSALFRDAIELEYLEANPAHRLRVRPNDPRLRPRLERSARGAVPPDEIHAFMEHVRPGYWAVCWTPVLTSARPGEMFAMRRKDIDRERHMIFVAETLTRNGGEMAGLKQTHHIADRERRGRRLLFPERPGWATACGRVAHRSTTPPAGCTRTPRASGGRWRWPS